MSSRLYSPSTISFRCDLYDDDVLSTTASDSGSSLPPNGQEKCNAPSFKELLDWYCEPMDNQVQSKLDDRFFPSHTPSQPCRPLPFF